jgi:hypothetical protein
MPVRRTRLEPTTCMATSSWPSQPLQGPTLTSIYIDLFIYIYSFCKKYAENMPGENLKGPVYMD